MGTTTLEMCLSGQTKPHALCFWGKDGLLASWEAHDLSPPSAGVGYQPDVILWHSLLWPASRGSSQQPMGNSSHCPAQQVSDYEKWGSARTGPGLPSPPPPFPHPQLHSETKPCQPTTTPKERKGKEHNLFQSFAPEGCLAAFAQGGWLSPQRFCCQGMDAQGWV